MSKTKTTTTRTTRSAEHLTGPIPPHFDGEPPHVPGFSETEAFRLRPFERDKYAAVHASFAALCATPEVSRFLEATVGEGAQWQYVRPRLGFCRSAGHAARQRHAAEGEVVHRCEFTHRFFAVPKGSPVPCIFFDTRLEDGTDPSGPSGPLGYIIHPALVLAGAADGGDAIRWALWQRAMLAIDELVDEIFEAWQYVSMAASAAEVPPSDAAEALRSGVSGQPDGWRDLPGIIYD